MLPSNHQPNVSRPERLEARVTPEIKQQHKYAADLAGRSLTDFVVSSANEAATRIIEEHQYLQLSLKDREVFVNAFLTPPKPSKNLMRAVKIYKKDVVSK